MAKCTTEDDLSDVQHEDFHVQELGPRALVGRIRPMSHQTHTHTHTRARPNVEDWCRRSRMDRALLLLLHIPPPPCVCVR